MVSLLRCISFFNYADREAILSLFPLLKKETYLTPVQLGPLGSAFAWVYGLCAPFAGSIVNRVRLSRLPYRAQFPGGVYTPAILAWEAGMNEQPTRFFPCGTGWE